MPLLQYVCPKCGEKFEELVKNHEQQVSCPKCGAAANRCYSGVMYGATGKPAKKCSGNCKTCGGCS